MNLSEQLGLPIIRSVIPRSEPDFYGASDLIAKKLGWENGPPVSNASWLHGWRFQRVKFTGELIRPYELHRKRHLIAKQEHEQFLRNRGWENVVTVGMPFTYFLSDSDLSDNTEKIPNSLLVMPPHTTDKIDVAPEERKYVEFIKNSVPQNTFICFCVHQDCEVRGYWINTLKEYGIPYVTGASYTDRNGLARMVRIYKHFETMTCNAFGSNVLQASLCGLRVAVCGPFHQYDTKSIIKYSRWLFKKDDIEPMLNILEEAREPILRERFPSFFCPIEEAKKHQEWAIEESGYKSKVSYEKLAELLCWNEAFLNNLDYHTIRYLRIATREVEFRWARMKGTVYKYDV